MDKFNARHVCCLRKPISFIAHELWRSAGRLTQCHHAYGIRTQHTHVHAHNKCKKNIIFIICDSAIVCALSLMSKNMRNASKASSSQWKTSQFHLMNAVKGASQSGRMYLFWWETSYIGLLTTEKVADSDSLCWNRDLKNTKVKIEISFEPDAFSADLFGAKGFYAFLTNIKRQRSSVEILNQVGSVKHP